MKSIKDEKKLKDLIAVLRELSDSYQRISLEDVNKHDKYFIGKADGLKTAANKLMSLL